MSHNLPTLLFVDAMVGAAAYTPALHEASETHLSMAAMDHVRRAQVDIYCSHDSEAMASIRDARRELTFTPTGSVAETLLALDEAVWFIRHNDFLHAEEALESALDHMRAKPGRHSSAS